MKSLRIGRIAAGILFEAAFAAALVAWMAGVCVLIFVVTS